MALRPVALQSGACLRLLAALSSSKTTGPQRSFVSSASVKEYNKVSRKKTFDRAVKIRPNWFKTRTFEIRVRRLGFREADVATRGLFEMLLSKMGSGVSPKMVINSPNSFDRLETKFPQYGHLYKDPTIMGQFCHSLGIESLSPQNVKEWRELAVYALAVAVELGNYDAALSLWKLESMQKNPEISATTMSAIKSAALNQSDWRAMSAYLERQLNFTTLTPRAREENYLLAKDLFTIVEPGRIDRSTQLPWENFESPWKLLMEAAGQHSVDCPRGPVYDEVQNTLEMAIRKGASDYKDPAAVRILSRFASIEPYCQEWLELKTKSAMTGDAEDCYALGKYWLEKQGWYPSTGNLPEGTLSTLGFDWMQLAAANATDNPSAMYSRYMIMALLLREHGQLDAGLEVVKEGIHDLNNNALDEHEAKRWIEKLESFERDWSTKFSANAAILLGDPTLKTKASISK